MWPGDPPYSQIFTPEQNEKYSPTAAKIALIATKVVAIGVTMVAAPEVGIPWAVADLTGAPVSPSPQAWSSTIPSAFNAATTDVAEVAIGAKASETVTSLKGTANPKVSEAINTGKQAHTDFSEKAAAKGWDVNPRLTDPKTGKTVIPDAVTPSGHPVELKPNTPSGVKKGEQQLPKYERAKDNNGRVVYYNPDADR